MRFIISELWSDEVRLVNNKEHISRDGINWFNRVLKDGSIMTVEAIIALYERWYLNDQESQLLEKCKN